jgi:dipeptidyl aminopeptidase/acylaminoacyl peptidase
MSQGILYKPENFDPHKRYPMIFSYYETASDRLHAYLVPDWTTSNINIPYYVSNGYLVFTPDIYYHQGHSGNGTVDALLSAAACLSRLEYVDSTKIGIEGHSFGGFETNFLVTHSHRFAAACSVSGVSEMINSYFLENGYNGDRFFENDVAGAAFGLNITPYNRTDLYIENSPVLFAGNATTPLLLAGGDKDPGVLFSQDEEMYYALRRAGKKVWLLEYENGYHTLLGSDGKDLTMRMKEFFDYYLKGAPPPLWMTRGVSLNQKNNDSGLDYDVSGAKP